MAISDDERAFFAWLGAHIAELRPSQDITQVQFAETLGVSNVGNANWILTIRG